MFIITYSLLWACSFYFIFFYITFVFSFILYILPQLKTPTTFFRFKTNSQTKHFEGAHIHLFLTTFLFLIFLINFTWVSMSITSWFGHIIFSAFQRKIIFVIIFTFYFCMLFFNTTFVFGSYEINDYYIVSINFFLWISSFFMANTLFSVIFLIEVLSTLVLLLVCTSTFATSYFYSNINYTLSIYQNNTSALIYFTSLLFFFWVSLLASLMLFFFLILFYNQFFTFDWNTTEFFFQFIFNFISTHETMALFFSWLFFFFTLFVKCGLVPFYFWKPTFFKGLPFHVLFFYIVFYYFFIFLFFVFFFFFYINEIFYVYVLLFNFLLLVGFFALFSVLTESFYLKIFLALSSILNTLFVFLVLSNGVSVDALFVL